jgi:hypothetical protein
LKKIFFVGRSQKANTIKTVHDWLKTEEFSGLYSANHANCGNKITGTYSEVGDNFFNELSLREYINTITFTDKSIRWKTTSMLSIKLSLHK